MVLLKTLNQLRNLAQDIFRMSREELMALYGIDPEEDRKTGERGAQWAPETSGVNVDELGHYFQVYYFFRFDDSSFIIS